MIASRIFRALLCGSMAMLLIAPGALARGAGRKALGEVTCFDGTYLEVELEDGSVGGGEVDEDVQVRLEHRGHHQHGRGHGNPSRGSLEDVVAGATVLRMKLKRGVVDRLRLRPSAAVGATGAGDVVVPCHADAGEE